MANAYAYDDGLPIPERDAFMQAVPKTIMRAMRGGPYDGAMHTVETRRATEAIRMQGGVYIPHDGALHWQADD